MRGRTRRGVNDHNGVGGRGVDEVRGGPGGACVGREHHLDGVRGPAEARTRARWGVHVHVGDVSAVWCAELDERVGELAGGKTGEPGLEDVASGGHRA